ncbi:MAG: HAMP domain-containing histidine kinase, partial [Chloroflexi bacterium]|nr:HAMP domain-containing histidine kinase [Chloroflexota bacterium]
MSLGTRLTLWQASLLTLLLTAFAALSHRTLDSSLRAEVDRVLRERAEHAALAVEVVPNRPISGISPGLSGEFASPGIYLQILDETGRIAARSANLGADSLPVHADRLADVLAGRSFYDVEFVGGQNARLYHRPIVRQGNVVGAIEVAASLRPLEDTLAQLRAIFVLGILAALIAGALGSYGLTRLGLRPLTRLAALAARIGHARDLAARIPYSGSPDEIGRLTVTFNDMLARLQSAFDAERHFLAEASHELRTPLAALLGNADLLARYGDHPERRAIALDAIRAEGRRLTRLLGDLILSVQADSGWRLELRSTSLAEVLQSVIASARPLADGVTLKFAAPPPVTVLGDPDRLGQVFANLVDNALRHTPAGGSVECRVTCDVIRRPPHVTVIVSDTGEGIPSDALPHIFDRFYRAPGSSRGSGL